MTSYKKYLPFLVGLAAFAGIVYAAPSAIRNISGDQITRSSGNTLSLPDATDDLVSRNSTDTLANKTLTEPVLDGGTASATSIWKLPTGDTATVTPLLDEAGKIAYDTDQNVPVVFDGTSVLPIGQGGSSQGVQLLENPDFESGSPPSSWAASGGVFSAEAGAPLFDKQSGQWDSDGSGQTLKSVAKTVPIGLEKRTCEAELFYSYEVGTVGDYTLEVLDGSSNELVSDDIDPTTGIVQKKTLVFTCPDSDTVQLQLESQVADANPITIDNAFLGSDKLNIQVGSAEVFGSLTYPTEPGGANGCGWSHSNSTFTTFSDDADCQSPTLTGNVKAPGTKIPGFTVDRPGKYTVQVNGELSTDDTCTFRLTDGGAASSFQSGTLQVVASNTPRSNTLVGSFTKLSSGDLTVQIEAKDQSAGNCSVSASSNDQILQFTIQRYPLDSTQSLAFDQADWRVDATIDSGANIDLGTAAVSPFEGIDDSGLVLSLNEGSAAAEIPCVSTEESSGTTCSSGSEQVGIAASAPVAGVYEACASFSHRLSNNAGGDITVTRFKWVQTANNSQTIDVDGKDVKETVFQPPGSITGTPNIQYPVTVCGYFVFSSSGKKTLRLFYEQDTSGSPGVSRLSRADGKTVRVTMRRLTESRGGINFENMVSTTDAQGQKVNWVRVDNSGTPTVESKSGDWLDATPLVDNGVGNLQAKAKTGVYSSAPGGCVCSPRLGADAVNGTCRAEASSATVIEIRTDDAAVGSAADMDFTLVCVGDK